MLMTSGPYYEYDEPQMSKDTIEALWKAFGDVCIDDQERIDSSFCGWPFGTDREEIWHWFDAQYAQWGGVHALMFPDEHKKSKFGKVSAHVTFQMWVHDYAIDGEEREYDCAPALDRIALDELKNMKLDEDGIDTDHVYLDSAYLGLVDEWGGPFSSYIDQEELESYIKAREEA